MGDGLKACGAQLLYFTAAQAFQSHSFSTQGRVDISAARERCRPFVFPIQTRLPGHGAKIAVACMAGSAPLSDIRERSILRPIQLHVQYLIRCGIENLLELLDLVQRYAELV